jgi:hypothetical protein
MIACWILFPVVLALLALGCGLLVELLAGRRLPGTLLLPAGYALIAVVAQLPAQWDATAELTVPLIVALALVGLGLGAPRLRETRPDLLAASAALGVFLVFALPVVAAGDPTFTGYIRLDDTASWLGITDRVMTHGTSLDGLEPSSYEAMLDFYLGSGYPLGGLLPLGIGGVLSGQDLAWVYQPHMAFLALLLALGLWEVARQAIPSRAARAASVWIAAQPASLFAYMLWGGFKELATAALLPTLAVFAWDAVQERVNARQLLPVALIAAALLGILSVGGAVWLLPLLLPALAVALSRLGPGRVMLRVAVVVGLVVAMSLPALFEAGFLDAPAASTITTQDRLANLIQPLSPLQVFGIWPAGDFRLRPDRLAMTYVLIGVLAGAALAGLALAWRAGNRLLPLYVGGTMAGAAVIYALGSPWVDAKALSIAASAPVLAAAAGAAAIAGTGRRVEACVLAAAIVGGVLWSNVLAYRDTTLAPHDRLAELASINERYAGGGPTLMTEFEPYGVRYFLRDMDPEGAGELRRRQIPLRDGALVEKGGTADIDEFDPRAVEVYRTLVLRRSPVSSRPPSVYERVWKGRFYEVWQRPIAPAVRVVGRLPLGDASSAGGTPRCADVARLAAQLGPGGRLLAAPLPPAAVATVEVATPPEAWSPAAEGSVRPLDGGSLSARVSVPRAGRYELWVGGATRAQLEASVDGARAGERRSELSYRGQFMPFGLVDLRAGKHTVRLDYGGADAAPGSEGDEFAVGPPALSLAAPAGTLRSYSPARSRGICAQTADWVEAVEPVSATGR